ncbi:hypothetical protein BZA77DRAFT_243517 [Pyronema omphalodes]|nr:hypothetical protein BZA77DRAFT_243517 [Pyronema omphalodes]
MSLQAIKYTRGSLTILDQLRLPHASVYVPISTCEAGWDAIKRMVVRGAPAIAIVAALALAVELVDTKASELQPQQQREKIQERLAYLVTSRPTAVNLADAAGKLNVVAQKALEAGENVVEKYLEAAEKMLVDDVADNKAIGDHGAQWIVEQAGDAEVAVLTHCNTGSLATAGYGTALGIIRSLNSTGHLSHAYCTETRPYNQGSRLTAYELSVDIPAGKSTLITDSMASSLLRSRKIAAIVVGADRVAANGDTANKIGTYQLAIVAKHHGVKFVVAAPRTTIDMNTASGEDIEIEQRPEAEVLETYTVAPGVTGGVNVYNPSFDVTPKDLIDAIATEKGVCVKNAQGDFELAKLFA